MFRGCAVGGVMVRPLKEEQGEDEKVGRWHLFLPLNFVCVLRGCAVGGVMVRPLKEKQGEDEKVGRWHSFPSVIFFACA